MKKNILLLVLAMLLSVASASAQGGTTGPLTWNLDLSTGTLTISGNGVMPNYDYGMAPWYGYGGYINTVVVEIGVTRIGNNAFPQCAMTSISIPNSVTTIGEQAFSSCWNLPSISLPNSVTRIESWVFFGCMSLTSVTIPGSVTTIGEHAFHLCDSLISITIPNSVTTIGDASFADCKSLIAIDVEDENNNYTSEDGVLFDKNKTTLICYPAGKIDASYVILNSVATIGSSVFSGCTSLTSITIPDGITWIRDCAFAGCTSLISIPLPNSVKWIGEAAFKSCTSLTSITIPNGVTKIENSTFSYCTSLTSITIPNSVKSIGGWAFSQCYGLPSITIPGNVTSIEGGAFVDCFKLTSITNLRLKPVTISSYVFSGVSQNVTLKVPTSAVSAYQNADVWKEFNIVSGGILVNLTTNMNSFGYTEGEGLYEQDEKISVIAIPYDGYSFVKWTKDGVEVSNRELYVFSVTEDVELVANFERNVGIVETNNYPSLRVFPNPTRGKLVVSTEYRVESIEIFDVMGRKVQSLMFNVQSSDPEFNSELNFKSEKFPSFGGAGVVINISHLPAGIYFIRIQISSPSGGLGGAGIITKKIIKQ
jgi:hypothetical protein